LGTSPTAVPPLVLAVRFSLSGWLIATFFFVFFFFGVFFFFVFFFFFWWFFFFFFIFFFFSFFFFFFFFFFFLVFFSSYPPSVVGLKIPFETGFLAWVTTPYTRHCPFGRLAPNASYLLLVHLSPSISCEVFPLTVFFGSAHFRILVLGLFFLGYQAPPLPSFPSTGPSTVRPSLPPTPQTGPFFSPSKTARCQHPQSPPPSFLASQSLLFFVRRF